MKAHTFYNGETVEVEVVSGPSSTGLCVVIVVPDRDPPVCFVRHKDRLEPLDTDAMRLLRATTGAPAKHEEWCKDLAEHVVPGECKSDLDLRNGDAMNGER